MMVAGDFHAAWRNLPVSGLQGIIGDGTCLILAPHPDDESLGCGGLIAACCAAGRAPCVAVLTDGTGSHPQSRAYPSDKLRSLRMQELRTAVAHLGLPEDRILFLDQKDTASPHEGAAFEAVVARLITWVQQESVCTSVLAPWRFDPHCDHEAAAKIVAHVANRCDVRAVAYPVWGWTLPAHHPIPAPITSGWRLDISAFLAQKRRAVRAHQSQLGHLITDDPSGFSLPPELLCVFETPFETFVEP
jgi:LmbE family N-acetylglucosaminyl deacetylase